MTDTNHVDPPKPSPAKLPAYAVWCAGILIATYLAMTFVMFFQFSGKDNPNWQNAMTVYNGFQAFATAAAGLLLGTTIQQTRVNNAERQAAQAKNERDAAHSTINQIRSAISDDSAAGGAADRIGHRD